MKTLKKIGNVKLVEDKKAHRYFIQKGKQISDFLSESIKDMLLNHCDKNEFLFFGTIMAKY
jgi:arginine repressor